MQAEQKKNPYDRVMKSQEKEEVREEVRRYEKNMVEK